MAVPVDGPSPHVSSLNITNSNIPSQNMTTPKQLELGRRGFYSDGQNRKPGRKLTYNPAINTDSAKYDDTLIDLRKITVSVPPNSRVTVTFTMVGGGQRTISFENTGPLGSGDMKGRIYLDTIKGQFAIAENDIINNKSSGPANNVFDTRRTLTHLKNEDRNIELFGNALVGAKKKAQIEQREVAQREVAQREVAQREVDSKVNKIPISTEVGESHLDEKQPMSYLGAAAGAVGSVAVGAARVATAPLRMGYNWMYPTPTPPPLAQDTASKERNPVNTAESTAEVPVSGADEKMAEPVAISLTPHAQSGKKAT